MNDFTLIIKDNRILKVLKMEGIVYKGYTFIGISTIAS